MGVAIVARIGGSISTIDAILNGALDVEARKLLDIPEDEPLPRSPDYMASDHIEDEVNA